MPTKVFTALDVPDRKSADRLVDALMPVNPYFKIGLELFLNCGPDWVRQLSDRGAEIFLDLKFHDIPNTVASAVRQAVSLGVHSTNVHAVGGPAMLKAAAEACAEVKAKSKSRTKLFAVTVLTSAKQADLTAIGVKAGIDQQVDALAQLARDAGLDGVVCSAHEIAAIRKNCGKRFLTMVPGIRPSWANIEKDDQSRVMTPLQAARAGADFLVIGRPIIKAPQPAQALQEILDSL